MKLLGNMEDFMLSHPSPSALQHSAVAQCGYLAGPCSMQQGESAAAGRPAAVPQAVRQILSDKGNFCLLRALGGNSIDSGHFLGLE